MVYANQWITSNEAVNEVGISCGSAQTILIEQKMRWDETRCMLHHDNATSHLVMAV